MPVQELRQWRVQNLGLRNAAFFDAMRALSAYLK